MLCYVFLGACNYSLHKVFSSVHVFFFNVIRSCYRLAQASSLRFNPLWRLMFFDFVIDAYIFGLARFVRVRVFIRCWRWVCVSIFSVTSFPLRYFDHGRLMFVIDVSVLAFDGVFSSPTPAFMLLEGAVVSTSIDIKFGRSFSSMVTVCSETVMMRYDWYALERNVFYVCLAFVFELYVPTASYWLSTSKNLFILKTDILSTCLL